MNIKFDVVVENNVVSVKDENGNRIFSQMGLPNDAHGDYKNWALWDSGRQLTDEEVQEIKDAVDDAFTKSESAFLAIPVGTRIDNRNGSFHELATEFDRLVANGTLNQEQNVAAELLAKLMTPEQATWEQAYSEKYGEPFTGAEREAIDPAGKLYLIDDARQVIVVTTPQAWAKKQIKRIEQAIADDAT